MNCNLAETICRKHPDATFRIAIEDARCSGSNTYTYGGLDYLSDKFSTVLCDCGIKQGDIVAVVLSPSAAFVVAHFAALKLGAIVAPFSIEIEPDLLKRSLKESQAKAVILDEGLFNRSQSMFQGLNEVGLFIVSDVVSKKDFGETTKGFWYVINFADADFKTAATSETTPAYIFLEQAETGKSAGTIFTHGLIVEGLRKNKRVDDLAGNRETPAQITNDWSAKDVLFELLYPAWFSGGSVMAGVVVK
jgi:acetyl-CoA synthetase